MTIEFSEIELRKIDLNLLLVFSAIMREGSVAKAADRLFIGPSAVSMALSRLRHSLDDTLFVKTSAGMAPTSRAIALWKRLAPALSSIESSIRSVRSFNPATAERTLRLAAPDDLDIALLPRLAARLSDEAPGIRMIIRPADYRSLGGRLDSGDADLALSATPTKLDPRHRHKSLYKEPFVALYDRSQLNSAGDLDIATYVETPHLFRSLSGDLRGQVDAALAAIGKERSVAMALSSFSAAPFLLRTQASLINIPAVAAYFFAKEFDLELSRLPIDVDSFPVSIIWHARSGEDPFHQWFRKLVSETCFELAVEAGVR